MTIEIPVPRHLTDYARRVLAVPDVKLLESAVRRFLEDGSPGEVVESIRLLMTDIDSAGYREGYHAAVLFLAGGGQQSRMPYGRAEELYRAAFGAGYTAVRYLLLGAPPRMSVKPEEVTPDLDMLDVPLGRRKAMARLQDRDILVRLTLDPHPQIVEILVENPRIVERDIVSMAARRPTLPHVIERIGLHPRWSLRYDVQLAVTQNPYAPTAVAVGLAPFLRSNHLREISANGKLHAMVRDAAAGIEAWRHERRGRNAEPIPEPADRH